MPAPPDLLVPLPAETSGGSEDTVVVASVRLPCPLHQRLRAYAAGWARWTGPENAVDRVGSNDP